VDLPSKIQEWLKDPRILAGAGGAIVLILILVLVARRGGGPRGKVVDDRGARARQKLRGDLRAFRDDLKKASAGAAPVFAKIGTETEFAEVVGHWRKSLHHRIVVRSPDLGALKELARGLGMDSMQISDMEIAWRKLERQIGDYNAGRMDASTTPIASIREFEKEIQKVLVLANMCTTKYAG
jgi:hypothetical protein